MSASPHPHILLPPTLGIDWAWVERMLAHKEHLVGTSASATHQNIAAAAADTLVAARPLVAVNAALAITAIASTDTGIIRTTDGLAFTTPTIARAIHHASHLVMFVVTIGQGLEKEVTRRMATGDLLGGYLLDSIGSFAAESLAETLEESLHQQCHAQHKSASMRFSPGYCDWPLTDQKILARGVDFSSIGVTLTTSCMMIPRKSVSAMMALGAPELFTTRSSPCTQCTQKSCDYRRIKK